MRVSCEFRLPSEACFVLPGVSGRYKQFQCVTQHYKLLHATRTQHGNSLSVRNSGCGGTCSSRHVLFGSTELVSNSVSKPGAASLTMRSAASWAMADRPQKITFGRNARHGRARHHRLLRELRLQPQHPG